MRRALAWARKGQGAVSPNPMVGAVIVKDGQLISSGYHHRFGADHAEIDAIQRARTGVRGATMYVTLEPCCFHGKTPPCVDRLIADGIQRVVIGTVDPDPRVNQRGIEILKAHHIQVELSAISAACQKQLEAYSFHRNNGIPFTTIKFAQSLDGQIATASGNSRWISSEASRRLAHQLRKENDAVMVGTTTVLNDDPQLNLRHVKGVNPFRVILDAHLRTPLTAKIYRAPDIQKTVVVTSDIAPQKIREQLNQMGVQIIQTPLNAQDQLDLGVLWSQLGAFGITALLVEGGSQLVTSILRLHLAQRLVVAVAPIILGQGIPGIGNLEITRIDQSIQLENVTWKLKTPDIILTGDLCYR
ncbi:bifunctional diaminohydroxyphosphoribosylaminopyrimidine deaminase/5-amino-6-(5-phosphoribosylamino)uracil reductase RibD [candidate division KSB1 bacterium]|nr:bifunctional diaminohydroxyphosphoribosylaminopyrimidine deaminase/5-amino-6-(5-phosphoribosylamino)uracil reductase RibD [candidate division KSB1 bacterium]